MNKLFFVKAFLLLLIFAATSSFAQSGNKKNSNIEDKADWQFYLNNYPEAKKKYDAILKNGKADDQSYTDLGNILMRKKDTAGVLVLLYSLINKVPKERKPGIFNTIGNFYEYTLKDEHTADLIYDRVYKEGYEGYSSFDRTRLVKYIEDNRNKGYNTRTDTILAIFKRLWTDKKEPVYKHEGVNYVYTYLLNPFIRSEIRGWDIRNAEAILDHDINVDYNEIIRDKSIIYSQSDYKYMGLGEKQENQKVRTCQMLNIKAAIQFMVGDIEESKQTMRKVLEVGKLKKYTSPEDTVYNINLSILNNRLNGTDGKENISENYWQSVSANKGPIDWKGNFIMRLPQDNEVFEFQTSITGDKELVRNDYHEKKKMDEESALLSAELLKQRIREQDEEAEKKRKDAFEYKKKGKKKWVFEYSFWASHASETNDDSDTQWVESVYFVYAESWLSEDAVKGKIESNFGLRVGHTSSDWVKTSSYLTECSKIDCNAKKYANAKEVVLE